MYDYDLKGIEVATGLSMKRRRQLVRFYSTLGEAVRIGVHQLQTDLIRQMRGRMDLKHEEYLYAAMLLALDRMQRVEQTPSNRGATAEDAAKASSIRVARIKADRRCQKRSPLRDTIILRFIHLIGRLREQEGLSWREIARYIRRYHGKTISHNYLRVVYETKRKKGANGIGPGEPSPQEK